jgi:hypothetical protein
MIVARIERQRNPGSALAAQRRRPGFRKRSTRATGLTVRSR